ncbi:MAG: signal peptidase I, partial [Christensenellales bacterium]
SLFLEGVLMEKLYYEKFFEDDEFNVFDSIKLGIKYFVFAIIIVVLVAMICGFKVFFVGGWSMQPTFDYMSLIVVDTKVDKYDLKIGDIATFNTGIVNTHRIISINYDGKGNVVSYETKGDNPTLTNPDPPLYPQNIIGRVVTLFGKPLTIPNIGYTVYDIQNNTAIVAVCIIALYLFFYATPNPRRYVRYEP